MSFQERRSIISLVSTLLIVTVYSVYMLQSFPQGNVYSPEVFRFWGTFFLILAPVLIVAKILTYIFFQIVNTIITREEESSFTDERDKLIELKAMRYSVYVFVFGFLLGMSSLVMNMPPSTMFVILVCSIFVSTLVSEISQFFFYRSGV